MSDLFSVRFAASGGSATGLGHVMRCAAIASDALASGAHVAFSLDGDEFAESALRREFPEARIDPWRKPRTLARACTSNAAGFATPPPTWIVFDTRRELSLHLRAARSVGAKTAVLDTCDYADDADITVLPVLHAPPSEHPRVLQGTRFCVLAPSVRDITPTPYPDGGDDCAAKARDLVLLTLGGADPLELTNRAAIEIERALEHWPSDTPRPELHCVLGPAFRNRSRLADKLRDRPWFLHESASRPSLARLMNRTLFPVVGFGTTIHELAYLGAPMAYLTHHPTDSADAHRLAHLGIGALAAEGHAFDAHTLRRVLHHTLLDPVWRSALARRGERLWATETVQRGFSKRFLRGVRPDRSKLDLNPVAVGVVDHTSSFNTDKNLGKASPSVSCPIGRSSPEGIT